MILFYLNSRFLEHSIYYFSFFLNSFSNGEKRKYAELLQKLFIMYIYIFAYCQEADIYILLLELSSYSIIFILG